MKQRFLLSGVAAAVGIVAFALRLAQNFSGFESDTGLPLPGHPVGIALVLFLAAAGVSFLFLARHVPSPTDAVFPDAFSTHSPSWLTVCIAGIFLMAAAGAWELSGVFSLQSPVLSADGLLPQPTFISPRIALLGSLLNILCAVCLFPCAAMCLQKKEETPRANCTLLLLFPPLAFLVRLILVYRDHSANPVLADYYVELLTVIFLVLGFYRLASFAVSSARPRHFAVYSCAALTLCLTFLADGICASSLLYLGAALTLQGFLWMYLFRDL